MAKSIGMLKVQPGALEDISLTPGEIEINFGVTPIDEMEAFTVDPETGDITESGAEEDAEATEIQNAAFNDNLACCMEEDDLEDIGTSVLEMVKNDIDSRKDWYEKLKEGLQRLGVYNPDSDADTGIAKVTHPLLLEAATQFQARAMTELLPPGGPVKSFIEGLSDEAVQAQASRVERYMNYQLTIEDRSYYDERDQMMFLLPFTGSEFDKQYYCPATERVLSRWVHCDDFIVPYNTKTLEEATRYTHVVRMTGNQLRAAMAAGVYDEVDLGEPVSTDLSEAPLTSKLQELDGQIKVDTLDADKEYTLYEVHIDYDVEGLVEAVPLPFMITIDSETGKVLSIYRNWKETDRLQRKRIRFTHKKFLPGFGFYGFGLLHCIGNLGDAASEILRILIDSGAFATLQGGFKSIDAKIKGDVILQPGQWQDTEMTADELQRAFYTPPWKEPSPTLEKLLGVLVDAGQRFASTTETMTGDAATTGPVGTMVAQIEQGSKVFSGIHKRLHKAFGDEFLHIAELNGEYLPDAYPYRTQTQEQNVLRADFDGRVDIIPVSDPNIFSSAQRIALAQSAFQMTTQLPDMGDRREAAVQLLTALRYPNPEKIFPKPADAQRVDPLNEGSVMLMGRPIKAFLDQDHTSHMTVHQGQIQGLPPQYHPLMTAHIAEHMAMAQYMKFVMMGVQLPPVKWDAEKTLPMMPNLPPEIETQIAKASAQAMQQMMQQLQQQQAAQQGQQPQGGANPQADAAAATQQKLQAQDAEFKQKLQHKDAEFQSEQQRKNAELAANVDREDALSGISPDMVKQAQEFITNSGVQMSPRELAVLSKALGAPFDKVIQAISRMQMGGQGAGPVPIVTNFEQNPARFT